MSQQQQPKIPRTKKITVADILKPANFEINSFEHKEIALKAELIRRQEAQDKKIKELQIEMESMKLQQENPRKYAIIQRLKKKSNK